MSADLKSFISILQMLGVLAVIISLAVLTYRIIKYGNNVDKRTVLMDGIGRIFIGVMLIGLLTVVSGFIIKYINDLYSHAGVDGIKNAELTINGAQAKDDSSFLSKIICWIIDKVTSFISPDGVGKSFFGLKSLNELIVPDSYNIFSKDQWDILMYLYRVTMSISFIVIIIMVFKTGIDFLRSSTNVNAYEEAKEDIYRWFFVAVIIAAGPIITKGIIVIGGWLTQLLNETFKNSGSLNLTGDIFKDITTGSDITTAIVKLYFAYLQFKINIIFIIRTWALAAFIVFTPIAVSLWGVNKNVNALPVWLGELITNAFMGFFYALVFTIYTAFLTLDHSVLFILVGLTMVIKLADVLRNTLQGFFTRLSGLDESRMANRFGLGTMAATAMGAYGMAKKGLSGLSDAVKGSRGEGSNSGLFAGAGEIVDKTIGKSKGANGANGMNEGLNLNKSEKSNGQKPNMGGTGNNEGLNINKDNQSKDSKSNSNDPVTKDGIGNNEGLNIKSDGNSSNKDLKGNGTENPVTKDGIGSNEGLNIKSEGSSSNKDLKGNGAENPVTKDGIGSNEGLNIGSNELDGGIDTQSTSTGEGSNEGLDVGSNDVDGIGVQPTSTGEGSNDGIDIGTTSGAINPGGAGSMNSDTSQTINSPSSAGGTGNNQGLKDVEHVRADFFNRLSQQKGFGNKNSNALLKSVGAVQNRNVINSLGKDMKNELKADFIRKNETSAGYTNNKVKLENDANNYAKNTFDKAVYGSKSSPVSKFTGNSRMAKGDFSGIKREIEQNDRNERVNDFLKKDK